MKIILRNIFVIFWRSNIVKDLIYFQHHLFPLPLLFFDWLFSNPLRAKLLAPYGMHVFMSSYENRLDNFLYWNSKESLYWHLYRQTDVNKNLISILQQNENFSAFLQDPNLEIVELGIGIGKTTRFLTDNHLLTYKHLIGTDTNEFVCNYLNENNLIKNASVYQLNAEQIIERELKMDLLMAHGGVFMYLSEEIVTKIFRYLYKVGCKALFITQEGMSGKDHKREDNTTMYDFRNRLRAVGYSEGFEFMEVKGDYSLDLFAMYPKK
ncbi:class I SAM-dependent methyltransferase [Leptospira ognonensis]|uniref:Class I SAM-dependent methyltransferase n=1 Tax=Leptospira ognonensis TaxID=2484945 RepID=A0A4V3JQL0_9LEPT|nr:class I SAM-dependent methyltransferase [Leptospira ognonensis]TGL56185.1 class I SAM-dependent methyltransferase [Leptospira ognonensis]